MLSLVGATNGRSGGAIVVVVAVVDDDGDEPDGDGRAAGR